MNSISYQENTIQADDLEDSFTSVEVAEDIKDQEQRFLVIAARYNVKSDAERHAATLERLGINAKSYTAGENEYYVMLKETKNLKKAEKEKAKHEKNGINCEIIPL
jgi:cell division protein FtsN